MSIRFMLISKNKASISQLYKKLSALFHWEGKAFAGDLKHLADYCGYAIIYGTYTRGDNQKLYKYLQSEHNIELLKDVVLLEDDGKPYYAYALILDTDMANVVQSAYEVVLDCSTGHFVSHEQLVPIDLHTTVRNYFSNGILAL